MRASESRTEAIARELLTIRGWSLAHPPKGQILWKNEYKDYPHIRDVFRGRGKTNNGGDGYPDFLVVDSTNITPLLVGETKAKDSDIGKAIDEASNVYGNALREHGFNVLAAGVAGSESENIAVTVRKHGTSGWRAIEYRHEPIQWLPTPEEASLLLRDDLLFDLRPRVPSAEVLADLGEQINRILRECDIIDQQRPAVVGAFMLALWHSKGQVRTHPEHILSDINSECRKAFVKAEKIEIADSIFVNDANEKLAAKASRICYILRLLNITTLTAEHDYLGQLYEMFFRFTGGNTIGQYFTPRHITKLMVDICGVGKNDYVIDPTCGTGGFLVSSLYRMIDDSHLSHSQVTKLVSKHLRGFESEPTTAALCVANMILRGDGTSGITKGDCFTSKAYPEDWATIALGNPPFPHEKTDKPPEAFVDRALEALKTRGTLAMILPISTLIKRDRKVWRDKLLKKHTLKAVIRLPDELFLPYAHPYTSIVIVEKGTPHPADAKVFFCHIDNDGYRLRKNVRGETPGEQLTAAQNAFRDHKSKAGFCKWSVLNKEWVPGFYIDSKKASEGEVRAGTGELMRGIVAFNAHFAPELKALRGGVADGTVAVSDLLTVLNKSPNTLSKGDTVGGLFSIHYGLTELENKDVLSPGIMPVISSSGTDNGCHGFYDFSHIASLAEPPFVTVPRTGSIGEAFVQMQPCGVTSDSLVLIPKEGTDIADMFIAAHVIRSERWRFNYGSKITPERIASYPIPRTAELKKWVLCELGKVNRLSKAIVDEFSGTDTETKFRQLADRWKIETQLVSNVSRKSMHLAYQQIIGMGKSAVPLILRDLVDHGPADWFWALTCITGENPIDESIAGNIEAMTKAWLQWGNRTGYLTDYRTNTNANFRTSSRSDTK